MTASGLPGSSPFGRRAGASWSGRLAGRDPRDLAAVAIVFAVLLMLAGALLVGIGTEDASGEAWKSRVKIIGLGGGAIGPGFSTGGAPFVGLALLVALVLAYGAAGAGGSALAPLVARAATVAAGWLVLFTLLGVLVDLTEMGDDFPTAAGMLLVDLGSLLIAGAALVWGLRALSRSRGI